MGKKLKKARDKIGSLKTKLIEVKYNLHWANIEIRGLKQQLAILHQPEKGTTASSGISEDGQKEPSLTNRSAAN